MWSTPVGPTHVVRWVPPPAVGTALLGLAFRDVLCSFVLLPTLTVLVVLLVVAWRTPATRISSVMVTVCCVFAALHWNATRPCHVRCLRTLRSTERSGKQRAANRSHSVPTCIPSVNYSSPRMPSGACSNHSTTAQPAQLLPARSQSFTFSPSTTSNSTVSPSPTLRRYFLGLFFFMAV